MRGTNIKQIYWSREGQKENHKLFRQASCFPLPFFARNTPVPNNSQLRRM